MFEEAVATETKEKATPEDEEANNRVRAQLKLLQERLKSQQNKDLESESAEKSQKKGTEAQSSRSSEVAASSWEIPPEDGSDTGYESCESTDPEEEERRRAWCEEHNQQCLLEQGIGLAQKQEIAPPKEGTEDPLPTPLPPETSWDLEVVRDLLELANNGDKVTWPKGLDPVSAKQLLQSKQPPKGNEGTI